MLGTSVEEIRRMVKRGEAELLVYPLSKAIG
jgi:hypothetical protein